MENLLMWLPLVLLSVMGLSLSAQGADLVGSTVPPFPVGMSERGGMCIGEKSDAVCEQSIGELIDTRGKPIGFYTGSFAGRDENGKAYWLVSDVIAYPKVAKGYTVVWGVCRNAGVEDTSISAVTSDTKEDVPELLPAFGWAQRVDRTAGKFLKLNPRNVDCYNTAIGSD